MKTSFDDMPRYQDGEVIGIENGTIVQWCDGADGNPLGPYNSGETPEEFGIHNLTAVELERLGAR